MFNYSILHTGSCWDTWDHDEGYIMYEKNSCSTKVPDKQLTQELLIPDIRRLKYSFKWTFWTIGLNIHKWSHKSCDNQSVCGYFIEAKVITSEVIIMCE